MECKKTCFLVDTLASNQRAARVSKKKHATSEVSILCFQNYTHDAHRDTYRRTGMTGNRYSDKTLKMKNNI